MMDFDKIKQNAMTEFYSKHPNLKNNESQNAGVDLTNTITAIAAEIALDMIKEYDRQQKEHLKALD